MESKKLITDAARDGDIETLNKLLEENPYLLDDIALDSTPESVLHVATRAEQVSFVLKLMKHKPMLAKELSADGFRPLDIAAIMGNVELVKELLRLDPGICLLKGKGQRTALHYAASKGNANIIDELVSTCPDCLKDVTLHQETALHLALKSYQFDAFKVLVKWLEIHKMQLIINWRDRNGNTCLHLAASKKQHESIELLFSRSDISATVDVNAKNAMGLTAADILDILMENPEDFRTREILRHAAPNQSVSSLYQGNDQQNRSDYQSENPKNWFKYFKFQIQRDSPRDVRNALLVVAALIATVTFQAGLTPPPGTLDKPNQPNSQNGDEASDLPLTKRGPVAVAGLVGASAIFGSHATSYLFLFSNSLGLTAALSIIIYLTGGFPFQRELLISISAMMFSYGFSISSALKGQEKDKQVLGYVLLTVAFSLPFLLRWLPTMGRMAWKKYGKKLSH